MTKIKKIVAAMAAALTLGAIGTTAFADDPYGNKPFALKFKAYEEEVFTNGARKLDTYKDPAAVRVTKGAKTLAPVEFSVWSSADELYGARLTDYAIIDKNNDRKEMPYSSTSGTISPYEFFYLHAYAMADMDIEGIWAP